MGFSPEVDQFSNESSDVAWICKPDSSTSSDAEEGSLKNGYWATEDGVKKNMGYNIREEADKPILIGTRQGAYTLYWSQDGDGFNKVEIDDLASGKSVSSYKTDQGGTVKFDLEIDTSGNPSLDKLD